MSFVQIVEDEERFSLGIGDSEFELRRFDSEVYRKLKKKHTTKTFRRGQQIIETDDDAVNDDIIDHVITGWRDVKHPVTGKDVPCVRQLKLKLPGNVKIEIIEACDKSSILSDTREADQKNSMSSSGSGQITPA